MEEKSLSCEMFQEKICSAQILSDFHKLSLDVEKFVWQQTIDTLEKVIEEKQDGKTCKETKERRSSGFDLSKNSWHGHFKGYHILPQTDVGDPLLSGNRKAVEINIDDSMETLVNLIRSNVTTFGVNLFHGCLKKHTELLVHLKMAELSTSRELDSSVSLSTYVKLSPRLPHSGFLKSSVDLINGNKVTITTDRSYSTECSEKIIYISGRFQMTDIVKCDIICIGNNIQVQVQQMCEKQTAICRVIMAGKLNSYMPVRYPARCDRYRTSAEELEDLTFALGMDVNIVVSYTPGCLDYFVELQKTMLHLKCEKMRLFARIILSNFDENDPIDRLSWAAEAYDGFVMEYNCTAGPTVIKLTSSARNFMQLCFDRKKPIIMAGNWWQQDPPLVDPSNHLHFYYLPDKYALDRNDDKNCTLLLLCRAMFEKLAPAQFAFPFQDKSHTGSDALARSIAAASFDLQAGAIIISSISGRMAVKVSHFRPKTPVVLVSHLKSVAKHILLYHNIWLCRYSLANNDSYPSLQKHKQEIFRQLVIGLYYGRAKKLYRDGHAIILVYRSQAGSGFPDKYICFNFTEENYVQKLRSIVCK